MESVNKVVTVASRFFALFRAPSDHHSLSLVAPVDPDSSPFWLGEAWEPLHIENNSSLHRNRDSEDDCEAEEEHEGCRGQHGKKRHQVAACGRCQASQLRRVVGVISFSIL
ncbi:hypothetical protein HPB52_005486 [Rhipicephalus sanguineus]|uniref:Uncharacterized protein n=1 Tax=Rhipicephalus sanguineus TaxID=34632 RepID=A0A9D4PUJ3_RHISA|nr:hypothetical protein HPB52_005486 [Rhipicephalus sanguineus]